MSAPHRPSAHRDHPRACGEHELPELRQAAIRGSSPRMRGTLGARAERLQQQGIIPAHAGNTSSQASSTSKHRDHPRACGEHTSEIPWIRPSGDHPRACGEHTSRLAQYRGFLIRSVCFLFSFILSTSLLAGIYWRCSIRDEEHRQKTLPSHWMAV